MLIRSTNNPWLRRFAWLTAAATLGLIGFGGLVTSHGAGMAVPDWPNTWGYNLFFFPVSKWVGGIFYEHTHRLAGAAVGLLTSVLAVWLWLKEERRWLRWLGVLAFAGVVFQGVLGGLRVTLFRDELGIFHAAIAQLFLVLTSAIALFQTRWWRVAASDARAARVRWFFGVGTGLVLAQLVLGATMRHQHAGLAVPDFPLAYGRLWPRMDSDAVLRYNQQRIEVEELRPITASGVGLQMTHRLLALVVLTAVILAWRASRRELGARHALTKLSVGWLALVGLQAGLGASTIWTHKSADVATGHVAVGAVCLVVGAVLALAAFRGAAVTAPLPDELGCPAPQAA